MKIAFLTHIESKEHYDTIRDGLLSKKNYCDKHGYDLVFNSKYKDELTKSKWDCIEYLLQFLNNEIIPDDETHYDYIFFSCSNSMITNSDFDLADMIESRIESEKHILVSSMIESEIKNNLQMFKKGQLSINNIILKNTENSKKIINRFYEQRFLQNPNLSIEEVFNMFMNHHFCGIIIKDYVQIINNPHLFNSIFDSSLNGWLCGDFILHENNSNNVKSTFKAFSSIVNTQQKVLNNTIDTNYDNKIKFDNSSFIYLKKYYNFVQKYIYSIIEFKDKKGEWFRLDKNGIAILYEDDNYWTFLKTD